jgi:hypothetical protein
MVSGVIWKNMLREFQRLQIALVLRTRAILIATVRIDTEEYWSIRKDGVFFSSFYKTTRLSVNGTF